MIIARVINMKIKDYRKTQMDLFFRIWIKVTELSMKRDFEKSKSRQQGYISKQRTESHNLIFAANFNTS